MWAFPGDCQQQPNYPSFIWMYPFPFEFRCPPSESEARGPNTDNPIIFQNEKQIKKEQEDALNSVKF